MQKWFVAAVAAFFISSGVQAATIDLSDAVFSNPTYDGTNLPINSFQENSAGVTFTFATAGQFRAIGPWESNASDPGPNYRLVIGGGGGSPASFTLVASQNVALNSFWGLAQQFNTNPIFTVSGTGVSSVGNTFSTVSFPSDASVMESFVGAPLNLTAGETYTFTVTNASASTVGWFTALDFTPAAAPVPLPASLPLLAGGLGLFGVVRRLRKK
jgi:hypothetical protein